MQERLWLSPKDVLGTTESSEKGPSVGSSCGHMLTEPLR